jgi:hypothetical protein
MVARLVSAGGLFVHAESVLTSEGYRHRGQALVVAGKTSRLGHEAGICRKEDTRGDKYMVSRRKRPVPILG